MSEDFTPQWVTSSSQPVPGLDPRDITATLRVATTIEPAKVVAVPTWIGGLTPQQLGALTSGRRIEVRIDDKVIGELVHQPDCADPDNLAAGEWVVFPAGE